MSIQQYWFNYNHSVTPSSLIVSWYNALAVKPSNALLNALNTLADGLDADGNWAKTDFLNVIAGMETEEQQLLPLKSTNADVVVKVNTPVLNSNGVRNNAGAGWLNLKWNPTDDGDQFTLNSGFLSTFVNPASVIGYGTTYYMGSKNTASFGWSYIQNTEGASLAGYVNNDGLEAAPSVINGTQTFYSAVVLNAGTATLYKNAATNAVAILDPVLSDLDFYGANLNLDGGTGGAAEDAYLRHFMAGSGTANQAQIRARLDTFYAARGL